ncbi:MAG: S1C family serine protease [Pseudonocardia sp.]
MLSSVALSVVLLAGLTACTAGPATAPDSSPPVAAPPGTDTTAGGYADLVDRVEPSVVTVRTGTGQGSGVVFRPDVVLTNQHVVADVSQVSIGYADGTTSPGTVLATDIVTDLAVIRTERTGLPVPEYGIELPRPGDVALALGSPLGFEGTVTAGIVSGLNRAIPGSAAQTQSLVDLIQTDAAISPGNSGGALIDTAGRVIGINEAYIPPNVGAVSLGFAIPSATAVDVAEQLLADGTADHPYLGASLGRLTPAIRQSLGVRAESGVLVLGVDPGGPVANAGVLEGDVITSLVERAVDSLEELLGALRGTEPGRPVSITVERGGELQTLTVIIGTRSS